MTDPAWSAGTKLRAFDDAEPDGGWVDVGVLTAEDGGPLRGEAVGLNNLATLVLLPE